MPPLISIITVCYNAEEFIEMTLQSVAQQTYPHIEHIIVDGASTDRTMEIVGRFPHITRKLSEPDQGLYDAMNKGLDMASGEYVHFLNSGDLLYDSEVLSRVFAGAQNQDFLYGDTQVFDLEGGTRAYHKRKPQQEDMSYKSFINGMVVCHQSIIVKRSKAAYYDFSRWTLACDIEWCIRTAQQCETYYDADIYISKFLDGGVSQNNRAQALRERFFISGKYFGWFRTINQQLVISVNYLSSKFRR